MVTQWLTVVECSGGDERSTVFVRRQEMDHLPDKGDGVVVVSLPGSTVYGDGARMSVERRWWDVDGSAHLSFGEVFFGCGEHDSTQSLRIVRKYYALESMAWWNENLVGAGWTEWTIESLDVR